MKEIFVERQDSIIRIAIKDNEKLKECYFEEGNNEPYPGEIYIGVVKNIVPAIKCAFIDIGYEKNCYMYMDSKLFNAKLKKGEELLVQVLKEDSENKGPKVTSAIEIKGRYSVLVTLNNDLNISQKIKNKECIDNFIRDIEKPHDVGIMIRTNAENVDVEIVNKEIKKHSEILNDMKMKCNRASKPGIVFDNGGILDRILKDKVDSFTSKIYVNNVKDYEYIKQFISESLDVNDLEIEFMKDEISIFDSFGIEKEILSLRNNKVSLKCGGYIVIDKTEALYAIDVNSGKNTKSNSIKKTAFNTNMFAAEEIGHQIRLRNLSGIIIVDFINMDDYDDKNKVVQKLRDAFEDDKNKVTVYPFTELNIVQIVRRKVGKSLSEYIEEDCHYCLGHGKRLKFNYIKYLISNEVIKILYKENIKDIHIEIDEIYKNDVKGDIINFVNDIGAMHKTIYVTYLHKQLLFNVEPLIFANQVQNLMEYKIYG